MSGLLRTASTRHAAELVRLGWVIEHQFFWGEDTEPYEIGLRWHSAGEPQRASQKPEDWITPAGTFQLLGGREMRHQHALK